jgi:type I restriction enzyme S subunit
MNRPLPNGWAGATLGDVVEIVRGVSYDKSEAREAPAPGLLPILRATNIDGRLTFDDLVYVPQSRVSNEQRLRVGDIVLAASSGSRTVVGKAAPLLTDWEGSFGAFCMVVRPKDAVHVKYVAHFMASAAYRERVSSLAAGVNINNLKRQHIAETPLPIAPLPEQARIVAELEKQLTRLDAGVAALKRVQVQLKRYRASVLKAACEGRLVPTEAELARREKRDYEPADKLLERILKERRACWEADQLAKMKAAGKTPKDDKWKLKYVEPARPDVSRLPTLPKGWVWTTIGAVGDVLLGRRRAPEYIGSGPTRPYLRVANIKDDFIDWSDVESMDFDDEHFRRYSLRPGDVLLSEGQSLERVGQSAIYAGGHDGLCFQATLNRFRPVGQGPSAEFAQVVFRSHVKSGVFMRIASITTNIAHLTLEKLVAAPFPLPPRAEQERIVAEVAAKMSVADAVQKSVDLDLARASSLRKAVLQQAFAGRLVPQSADDEPASKLLERITHGEAAPAPATSPTKRRTNQRATRSAS